MFCLVVIFATFLVACSFHEDDLPPAPIDLPVVDPSPRPPRPAPVTADPVPTQTASPAPTPTPVTPPPPPICTQSVVGFIAGKQCGFDTMETIACPNAVPYEAYVYVCRGGEKLRPPIEGCRDWDVYVDGNGITITRVICPTVEWVPFEDGRCGS
jgi:hypothetical protein